MHEASLKISSTLSLYLKINDPEEPLNVITDGKDMFKEKRHTYFNHSLNKSVFHNMISVNSQINHDLEVMDNREFIWVSLSSLNNLGRYRQKAGTTHYKKIINQPLPGFIKAIVAKASKISGESQTNQLYHFNLKRKSSLYGRLALCIRQIFPKKFGKISSSRAGDYKDFSVSTAAIYIC